MIYSDINVLKSNEIIYGQTGKAQRLFPDIEQYILDIISSYEVDHFQTIVFLQILQLLLWTKSRLLYFLQKTSMLSKADAWTINEIKKYAYNYRGRKGSHIAVYGSRKYAKSAWF